MRYQKNLDINSDMKPKWIGYYTEKNKIYTDFGAPSPFFRKCFNAENVKRAQLNISSLGLFKAYINGKEVDNDILLPNWTDFNKRVYYYSFDITHLIKENNCIGVILGDGWYTGNIAWFGREKYGNYPLKLWAEIILTFKDGKEKKIITDTTWKANKGHILYSDIINGEYHDNRLSKGDFSLPGYTDTDWSNANIQQNVNIIPQKAICPPTRIKERLECKKISECNNIYVYDCSQNFAGIIKAHIKGEKGAIVRFKYGEMLNEDGTVYTDNLRKAMATDYYVCSGGENETFQPLFTYHGFRYIEVKIEGNAEIEKITGLAIYNDIKTTGHFECSDGNINKLFNNILWSQKSNFIAVPTDCPQRDERLGWTGDAQVFCRSAMYNMDCKLFFEKYLIDVNDAQTEEGMIESVAPNIKTDFDAVNGSAAWGDVITVLPYNHYLMYKDKKIIRDNIKACKKWIDFCLHNSENYIRPAKGYGDWLNIDDETDKSVLSTAFFAYSCLLTYKMLKIINENNSSYYYDLYENIKKAFVEKFIYEDNKILSDTQTCYLLAYTFKLMPKEDIKPHLMRTLQRKNNHLSCGFVGVKYLLPVLCDIGETDTAYEVFTKTTYPSWCYSVLNEATTIWERWNSYTKEKGFASKTMNSFNHYSLGSCAEWIYRYVLGIEFLESGDCLNLVIKPFIDTSGKINFAQGWYETQYGKIKINWQNNNKTLTLNAEIPNKIKHCFDLTSYKVLSRKKDKNIYTFVLEKVL